MDGGRVLRALLAFWVGHSKATKVATGIGQVFGVAFFVAGFLYNPMLIFMGLFIFLSGQYESSLVKTAQFLHQYTVNDVLMREIHTIKNSSSIKEAAQALLNSQNKNFVVTNNGKPVGTISRRDIVKAIEETGEKTLVQDVENKKLSYVSEMMPLDQAWKMMQHAKKPLILVGSDGHLEGMLDEENITEFIMLRSASATKK